MFFFYNCWVDLKSYFPLIWKVNHVFYSFNDAVDSFWFSQARCSCYVYIVKQWNGKQQDKYELNKVGGDNLIYPVHAEKLNLKTIAIYE